MEGNIFDYIFLSTLYFMFLLIWLVILSIGKFAPKYLDPVRSFLTLYIGGLLFVRYNPVTYKDRNFREFDRRLIFTCSIFLLLSTALITGIRRRIEQKAGPIVQDSISDIKDNIGIKA